MDLWLRRIGEGLVPDSVDSAAEFARLPFGKSLHCEVKQPRNSSHHRLYWALCARIAQAKDLTSENVSDLFKIASGHCEIIRSKKYGDIRLPKSISFAKMEQTEFSAFFERCVKICYEEWQIPPEAVSDLLAPQGAHLRETA